ncbi:hypothetical protein CANCADRAFT_1541 [Tortispora caseinolytica NRRL Y-17796]|uniref:cAMP-independent regulatory protein pac2 n=1 Tax=Tortispora caseinolytica NRRL Y-17796 TaxID=767744 RepID=A0A1E4TMG6_9ASCO|nr:hypothetical protein CANCADRAFT_1541 [Tortispora caseinolytica NRRL Y-17796]
MLQTIGAESYYGALRTTWDAILLVEAARIGKIPKIKRRLISEERSLIRPGSIFIWDEAEADIKRWTDGKSWSSSRLTGSFLVYREIELCPPYRSSFPEESDMQQVIAARSPAAMPGGMEFLKIPPLPEGYRILSGGLIKQSFSISTSEEVRIHLIAYSDLDSVLNNPLVSPSNDIFFSEMKVSKETYPALSHEAYKSSLSSESAFSPESIRNADQMKFKAMQYKEVRPKVAGAQRPEKRPTNTCGQINGSEHFTVESIPMPQGSKTSNEDSRYWKQVQSPVRQQLHTRSRSYSHPRPYQLPSDGALFTKIPYMHYPAMIYPQNRKHHSLRSSRSTRLTNSASIYAPIDDRYVSETQKQANLRRDTVPPEIQNMTDMGYDPHKNSVLHMGYPIPYVSSSSPGVTPFAYSQTGNPYGAQNVYSMTPYTPQQYAVPQSSGSTASSSSSSYSRNLHYAPYHAGPVHYSHVPQYYSQKRYCLPVQPLSVVNYSQDVSGSKLEQGERESDVALNNLDNPASSQESKQ